MISLQTLELCKGAHETGIHALGNSAIFRIGQEENRNKLPREINWCVFRTTMTLKVSKLKPPSLGDI